MGLFSWLFGSGESPKKPDDEDPKKAGGSPPPPPPPSDDDKKKDDDDGTWLSLTRGGAGRAALSNWFEPFEKDAEKQKEREEQERIRREQEARDGELNRQQTQWALEELERLQRAGQMDKEAKDKTISLSDLIRQARERQKGDNEKDKDQDHDRDHGYDRGR